MAADPTPEERAAGSFNRVFEGRGPMYVARLADLIREAETAARAKAFEEAAAICSDVASDSKSLQEQLGYLPHARTRQLTAQHLAEAIRARAKEAPRG